jgi:hypothetical protein
MRAQPITVPVIVCFAALGFHCRGHAVELNSSEMKCVERPVGIRSPPKRLAPILRAAPERSEKSSEDKKPSVSGVSALGIRALCPKGQIPQWTFDAAATNRGIAKKGNPLIGPDVLHESSKLLEPERAEFIRRHVKTFEEVYRRRTEVREQPSPPPPAPPSCDGIAQDGSCYYYGSAGFETAADGGGMTNSINKPVYINSGGSGHTLNEISVQGGENNGNIVELGWLVSSDQYGNDNPHIFVFHWKNWAPTCYDTCGWQQWSNTYHPGMDLRAAVGKDVYIGYVLYQGNWWAWFDNQWMGYFPGTEWDGKYTKTALIQWFGEVASDNGIPPKTQMGDGQLPTAAPAASMQTLCDVDAKAWICWYRDKQSLTRTVPKYYDISRTAFGATRYGGPGQ